MSAARTIIAMSFPGEVRGGSGPGLPASVRQTLCRPPVHGYAVRTPKIWRETCSEAATG